MTAPNIILNATKLMTLQARAKLPLIIPPKFGRPMIKEIAISIGCDVNPMVEACIATRAKKPRLYTKLHVLQWK